MLKGSVAVVTGATGVVGGGIVQRFLQEGFTVVAPRRSAASKLTGSLTIPTTAQLHTPVADWGTEAGATELAKFIKEAGLAVDHVVSVAGGMAPPGNVPDITPALLHEAIETKVLGHVLLAQALLPLMRQEASSSWTVITGTLGEVVPMPGVALTAISNAAVFGLVKVLQFEANGSPVRVNELRIAALVRRDSDKENPAFPGIPALPASKVGGLLQSIATGRQRDEVIHASPEVLEAVQVPAF